MGRALVPLALAWPPVFLGSFLIAITGAPIALVYVLTFVAITLATRQAIAAYRAGPSWWGTWGQHRTPPRHDQRT